ncbi:hypothetical protein SDC9_114788 [bioreactor metagenome]|uniref:Uncharacterized protein n=1 Tax=bioreactor metagenome TaxID=1076179 RepID=A0A645BXM2_9ZZZZ
MFHYILGTATFTSGVVIIALSTDFGRDLGLSFGAVFGSLLIFLGMARIKQGWLIKNDKNDKYSKKKANKPSGKRR